MDADVLIVGAGLSGLTLALELARRDLDVAVLEREPVLATYLRCRDLVAAVRGAGATVHPGCEVDTVVPQAERVCVITHGACPSSLSSRYAVSCGGSHASITAAPGGRALRFAPHPDAVGGDAVRLAGALAEALCLRQGLAGVPLAGPWRAQRLLSRSWPAPPSWPAEQAG